MMDYPPSRIVAALRSETYHRVTGNDTVWMCIACSACTSVCPAQIPVTLDIMTRTKENLILAGVVPVELQDALENSQHFGNPMGESPRKRGDWTRGIESLVPTLG